MKTILMFPNGNMSLIIDGKTVPMKSWIQTVLENLNFDTNGCEICLPDGREGIIENNNIKF